MWVEKREEKRKKIFLDGLGVAEWLLPPVRGMASSIRPRRKKRREELLA